MTQEEKAKAYDEALEQARKIHNEIANNELLGFLGQIEDIFPELRKEEKPLTSFQQCLNCILRGVYYAEVPDEKVNEFILNVVRTRTDELIKLAKKQEEQKHPDGCFTCDEYKKGYETGRLNGFTAGYNKAIKEQKPVEGDNETEIQKAFREGKSAGRKEVFDHPEEYGLQKHAEWNANDKAFIKDCAHILDENGYAASAERLLSMFPVKPAEWSEKDKEMIQFYLNFTHHKLGNWPNIKVIEMREKFKNWLKSLPERFNLQPKQEWNEEDEEMIGNIINTVRAHFLTITEGKKRC